MTIATEKTTYKVFANGCPQERGYKSEAAAVEQAQLYGNDIDGAALASVVMIVESGEHKSETQVWPTVGRCVH